jgi:hypothetical protein
MIYKSPDVRDIMIKNQPPRSKLRKINTCPATTGVKTAIDLALLSASVVLQKYLSVIPGLTRNPGI